MSNKPPIKKAAPKQQGTAFNQHSKRNYNSNLANINEFVLSNGFANKGKAAPC